MTEIEKIISNWVNKLKSYHVIDERDELVLAKTLKQHINKKSAEDNKYFFESGIKTEKWRVTKLKEQKKD